ncbi:hypothetical protein QCA50_019048 [Cerrena zonata]|uniref:Uncharacterized protein n=1 Tax=Cerrena zonata TaxID=2478898 RepID=A0AAW0FL68_9APHY
MTDDDPSAAIKDGSANDNPETGSSTVVDEPSQKLVDVNSNGDSLEEIALKENHKDDTPKDKVNERPSEESTTNTPNNNNDEDDKANLATDKEDELDEKKTDEKHEGVEPPQVPEKDVPNTQQKEKLQDEEKVDNAPDSTPIPSNGQAESNGATTPTIPQTPEISIHEDTTSGHPLRVASLSSRTHTRQQSTISLSSNATVDNTQIFKKTFDLIMMSKEAKKNEELKNAVQKAIDSLNDNNSRDPHVLFNALKLTCESSSNDLKSKAVDLFAKLFDYALFDDDEDKVRLTDDSVDVVASCFDGEGTDPEVELQVIYNVFIFSLVPRNQAVAQGILTQVIGAVFQRITDSLSSRSKTSSTLNLKSLAGSKDDLAETSGTGVKLTLENLENFNNEANDLDRVDEANKASEKDEDLAVKDAFLIFRSMCKLSIKSLDSETLDMRSHSRKY